MRARTALCLLPLLVASACASVPPASSCEPLGEFPGPEDFELITRDGALTLLASARDRRDFEDASRNGIWAVDWDTRAVTKLDMHGRDGCWLAPHGIAAAEVEPGRWELWTINHYQNEGRVPPGQPEHCQRLVHGIEHFRVDADGLHFIERLPDPEGLLTNPNEIDALPDGRLWLSNNPPWVGGKGLAGDVLFKRAKGQVLHYSPEAGFSLAAERMVFPNGMHALPEGDVLWVSAAHGLVFRLELDEQGHERTREQLKVAKPKATLDNFLTRDGALWVTGHPKGLAFVRHTKDESAVSPTVAYRVALDGSSERPEAVAYWGEGQVNGGATIVPLGDRFVLGPAFSEGLRVCGRTD